MAKSSKGVKAINTEKMIPESVALKSLQYFCNMVVFGNDEARLRLLEALHKYAAEDSRKAVILADCVMTIIVLEEEFRKQYAKELADNDEAMELLNAAMDIGKILNLNAYDDICKKINNIDAIESEIAEILLHKSADTKKQ